MTITELVDPFKKIKVGEIAKGGLWVSDFAMLIAEGFTIKLKSTG